MSLIPGTASLRSAVRTSTFTSSKRVPKCTRAFVTASHASRQRVERLPPGHVRPRRRPRQPRSVFADAAPYVALGPNTSLGEPIHVSSRPVIVPPDSQGALQEDHAALELLAHDTLVVVRQIEMLNIFMGFEQANRYAIQTPEGEVVGFLAEEEQTFVSTMSRQFLRTHRPFRAVIMDKHGHPILWIRRPFQLINSRIYVRSSQEEDGKLVGEAQQEWHPWRRRYNVFQSRDTESFKQFARVDSGLWAWDFWLKDRDDRLVASINRNFRGLGRELFTDTGQYVIRFDSAGTELDLPPGSDVNVQGQKLILPKGPEGGLTLDQRAMVLATAVSIDFDYFSRHSGSGGMGFPFLLWGGGDGGSDINRGRPDGQPDLGSAGAGAAAGAAGAGQADRHISEDEQIYGRQTDQSPTSTGGESEPGWNPDDDDAMQDPWSGRGGDDNGLFGGGSDGGSWGNWGDWES